MKLRLITVFSLAAVLLISACGKSDADLQKAAETAVKAKAPTATVVVAGGVATLSGEVENEAAKAAAEAEAGKVEGIKSVTSNLTVKPAPTPALADAATKTAIDEEFKKKGFTDITVEATMTEITLRGSVAADKYTEAFQIATEIGNRKVNNQLSKK